MPAVSTITIHIMAGMKVKIKSRLDPTNYMGFFAHKGTVVHLGKTKKLINGFLIEFDDVGELKATKNDGASVIYHHKKPEEQKIWFYAATGEKMSVEVSAVPIHDHSSVVQGGPAYGTYFSDDETVT